MVSRSFVRYRLILRIHLTRLGTMVVELLTGLGQLCLLLNDVLKSMWYEPQRRAVVFRQMYRIGYQSLPVVILTGISMGLVIAIQGYHTLRQFNGENITGGMVNFSLLSQIMPVTTGLTLAGRVGSSIAAEIGAMRVSEQIDALRAMGSDPIGYLVTPRFLACVLLMPFLTAIGALAGVAAASMLVINLFGVDKAAYWYHSQEFLDSWTVLTGLGKTVIYGGIIALVACRQGLRTDGGASGVGESCTSAVVTASMMILVATFVMTVLFQKLYGFLYEGVVL